MSNGVLAVHSNISAFASVEILDINGRMVYSRNQALSQGENRIAGNPLARGFYFLTVKSGTYAVHQRLNVLH